MNNETYFQLIEAIRNHDLKTVKAINFNDDDFKELNTNKFSILKLAYDFNNIRAFKYFLKLLNKQSIEVKSSIISKIDFTYDKKSDFHFLYQLSKNGFWTNSLASNEFSKSKTNTISLLVFTCLVKQDHKTLNFIKNNYFSNRKNEMNSLIDLFNEIGSEEVEKTLEKYNSKVVNNFRDESKKSINLNSHKYQTIQCISYAPVTSNENSLSYNGFKDDGKDSRSRITVLNEAIDSAYYSSEIERNPKCLKIFMVPEFFFRGRKGAYSMERTAKITNSLRKMVESKKYKDWLFVFGTTVGYSKEGKLKENNLKEGKVKEVRFKEVGFKEVNLNEDNSNNRKYTAYNYSFIQQGGSDEKNSLIVMKENKSNIDFIDDISESKKLTRYNTKYLENVPTNRLRSEEKNVNFDGNSIFEIGGLRIAVEICLDNIKKRIDTSNLEENKKVDVLLVPACGVGLSKERKFMSNEGVMFTVDGYNGESNLMTKSMDRIEPLYSKLFIPSSDKSSQKLFCDDGEVFIYPVQNLKKSKYKIFEFEIV